VSARDTERQKVYDAEALAWDETLFAERIGMLGVHAVAKALFDHPWWVSVAPKRPKVEAAMVRARRGYAHEMTNRIRIPHVQEHVVCLTHEAAHLATWQIVGSGLILRATSQVAAHGPEFRSVYVDVAHVACGQQASERLAKRFREAGLALAPRTWPEPVQTAPYGLYGLYRLGGRVDA
jgi:hypothetical protein